jgi:FdhE protein
LDAARTRWAQLAAEFPGIRPALPLHQALLELEIELLEGVPEAPTPDPADLDALAAALAGGTPAFRAVHVPGALGDALPWLGRFSDALSSRGAGPSGAKVKAAFGSGQVDPVAFLAASWHRDAAAAAELTKGAGLNLQVVWLVAELASAPFAHRWQAALLEASEPMREAVASWRRGYCPACGAWPSLGEYFLGDRLNRCAYCAAAWPLPAPCCTYCGEAGDDFRIVAANRDHPGRRLELCRKCGGYLKTLDVARPTPFPLLSVEDLGSQDLDQAAIHHGFRRTGLRTTR